MPEYVKMIAEYSVLIVIAAVFIWDKVAHSKVVESILKELQTSSKLQSATLENLKRSTENASTALNIIQNTLYANSQALDRHDKRSEFMNNDIREMSATLKSRPCISRSDT